MIHQIHQSFPRPELYSKQLWWQKSLAYRDSRKFGGKNFGELKSICIGNVKEIVKIGEKTWQIGVIHQILQSFLSINVFHCTVYYYLLYTGILTGTYNWVMLYNISTK